MATTDNKLVNLAGLKEFKTKYTDTYIGTLQKQVTDKNGVKPGETGYEETLELVTVKEYVDAIGTDAAAKIAALDTSADIALATAADGVVTIKGIKEVDGVIAASEDTTKDVTFAKVATTGNATDVVYKAESTTGAGDGETVAEAITRLGNDLTYKGTTTTAVTNPAKGDLYNFNIAADGTNAAVVGWKFYDGTTWQDLSDATASARVAALETQVGKDKTVTEYQSKSDLVDIVNVLTGTDTVDGSVAKSVKDAVEALDTTDDVTTASVADGVVTLTAGIAEEDGKIKKGSGTDITLAKVATTGAAADISITDASSKITATTVEGALTEIATNVETNTGAIATLNGAVTADGSVLKKIKDNAKDAIYTTSIASYKVSSSGISGNVYIKVEDYNALVAGGASASDVQTYTDEACTLANGTVRCGYSDITKPNTVSPITKAGMTIAEGIADAKASATSASAVTITEDTSDSTILKSYIFTQNGSQIGKINLAKDLVVTSGAVETYNADNLPSGLEVGTYIKLTIANQEAPIYINVKDLVDVYTAAENATEVQVAISDANVISATLNATLKASYDGAVTDVTTLKADVDTTGSVLNSIKANAKDATYSTGTIISYKVVNGEQIEGYFKPEDLATFNAGTAKVQRYTDEKCENAATGESLSSQLGTAVPVYEGAQTIAEAIAALEASAEDTNGAFVFKGTIATLPTTGAIGDAYLLTTTNTLYICTAAEIADPATNAIYTAIAVEDAFTVNSKSVSVKRYIDSRIFIGTQDEVTAAKTAGTIDDSTFVIVTDEDSQELVIASDDDIDGLF